MRLIRVTHMSPFLANAPAGARPAGPGRYIDALDDLRAVRECVVLYSGGLDSRYFLAWAGTRGISVVALHVWLGAPADSEQVNDAELAARALGAEYVAVDHTNDFAMRFIAPAIRANAMYHGVYPVCSSLSRPLMAEVAVELARARGIRCIVHGSTWIQNSAFRLNNSIRALDADITIACPFASAPIDREAKAAELIGRGVSVPRTNRYSIDANLWGRVIEAGPLDDPATPIPEDVYSWTKSSIDAPRETIDVEIRFERGLPVALNGEPLPLATLITMLNTLGGKYGVGRFNGMEDLHPSLGHLKNHEVREAPAAQALLTAHRQLEQALLTQDELRWKWAADWEWTRLVVNGHWHSPLQEAIDAASGVLSHQLTGVIRLRYAPGAIIVTSIIVPAALGYRGVPPSGLRPSHSLNLPPQEPSHARS